MLPYLASESKLATGLLAAALNWSMHSTAMCQHDAEQPANAADQKGILSTDNDIEQPASCGTLDFDTDAVNGGADTCCFFLVSDGLPRRQAIAQKWIPLHSGYVCEVSIVLGAGSGSNSFTIRLFADNGGIPGEPLASANFASINTRGSAHQPQLIAISAYVQEGIPYWVEIEGNGGGTARGFLYYNAALAQSDQAFNSGGGWTPMYEVSGCWQVYLTPEYPLTLTQSSADQCATGGPLKFKVSGATPGDLITLVSAKDIGTAMLNGGACAGTVLGLGYRDLRAVGEGQADNEGVARFARSAPRSSCGRYLQAINSTSGCTTSNVIRIF